MFRIDDALDLFAEHAIGGIIGLLLNAFLADSDIIALDGVSTAVEGGFMNRNWKALYIQFAYVCATCAYTFVMTALLAKAIDMVPGLHLRGTPEEERVGMDEIEVSLRLLSSIVALLIPAQIGEFATDYIEITRDFDALMAQYGGSNERSGPQVAAGDRHGRTELGANGSGTPRAMTPVVEESDGSDVSVQHEIIASKKDNEGSLLV